MFKDEGSIPDDGEFSFNLDGFLEAPEKFRGT